MNTMSLTTDDQRTASDALPGSSSLVTIILVAVCVVLALLLAVSVTVIAVVVVLYKRRIHKASRQAPEMFISLA